MPLEVADKSDEDWNVPADALRPSRTISKKCVTGAMTKRITGIISKRGTSKKTKTGERTKPAIKQVITAISGTIDNQSRTA